MTAQSLAPWLLPQELDQGSRPGEALSLKINKECTCGLSIRVMSSGTTEKTHLCDENFEATHVDRTLHHSLSEAQWIQQDSLLRTHSHFDALKHLKPSKDPFNA